MNLLRDNKGAFFAKLTPGERVRLMMRHSYEIQRSYTLRNLKEKLRKEPEQK
jgi:hypothetical protein